MHILFISSFDFSAHKGGGATYTRSIIDLMSGPPLNGQVDHLWPERNLRGGSALRHRARQLRAIAGSSVGHLPAKALFARSGPLVSDLRRRLSDTAYDLIVVNGSDNLWILPELPSDIPVALVSHNIEHKLYAAQIENLSPVLKPFRPLLRRDCRKLERYETEGFKQLENIISISTTDSDLIRSINSGANLLEIPPVFSYPPFEREVPGNPRGILDIGYMAKYGWWPNREGIIWFVNQVLPALDGKVRLHLFGQGSEDVVGPHPQIIPHGFVDDIADIWATCDFMICPIFSGSGVNVKFAEGIYNGMPVLGTPFAARGLTMTDYPSVVLLSEADEWVDFLRSSAAERLASTAVSDELASTFAMDAYRGPIKDFSERAARSKLGRASRLAV